MTDLGSLAISDNGFVFDPRTGHAYTVNATGLVVLRGLKEGRDSSQITEDLRARYPQRSGLEEDVRGFVRLLVELGLTHESLRQ